MATYTGIDLSVHNGYVDMPKVKASGIYFVMLRSSYGDILSYPRQIDGRFASNLKNAKSAGLNVGVYHYMYATTVSAAKREAEGFVNLLKGNKYEYPVALDIEESSQYNLSAATIGQLVTAFIDVVEKAGYYCFLYSYEAFLNKVPANVRSKYDVWCANISRTPSIKYGMHQYSFTGSVNGVSGNVDMNRTSKDYPTIMKSNGLNGFTKSGSSTTKTETTTKPAETKPAASTEKLMTYKVNATGLRYRAEPSIKGTVCGTFKNGQTIKVVKGWGRTASGYIWYKTKIGSKYYYVAAKYLKYVSG